MNSKAKIEFGDFQTPPALARQICEMIRQRGIAPDVVMEPTCGVGLSFCLPPRIVSRCATTGLGYQ